MAKITVKSKDYDYEITCSDETAETIHEHIWGHKNIEQITKRLLKKDIHNLRIEENNETRKK